MFCTMKDTVTVSLPLSPEIHIGEHATFHFLYNGVLEHKSNTEDDNNIKDSFQPVPHSNILF